MKARQKELLRKCCGYLIFSFFIIIIFSNLYLGINKAITHNPVPKIFGYSPLIVMSGSMEPAIYPGDLVVIREQPAEEYQIGDVATYLQGETVYTHRIVDQENGLFVLKGDSNNAVDDSIAPSQFVGKVIFTIPKIGIAIVFFKRPAGMALLALALMFFIIDEDLFKKGWGEKVRKKMRW